MITVPAANLSGGTEDPAFPALVCTECGNADELLIERLEATKPSVPGLVSVEYSCSACDAFYAHDATVRQVAQLLNKCDSSWGVLYFDDHYVHCGEPMKAVDDNVFDLGGPASSGGGPDLRIPLEICVLKCRCGFQLDVPR